MKPRQHYNAEFRGRRFPVQNTRGRVHSVFHRALNVELPDGNLAGILSPQTPRTSWSIRLETDIDFLKSGLESGAPCLLEAGRMCIGDVRIDLAKAALWEHDRIAPCGRIPENVLPLLRRFAEEKGYPGLCLLLAGDAACRNDPVCAFAATLLPALQKALEESHPQNTAESLLPLMGMGYGLTPGGDDFIGGLLAALHLAESPERDRPSGFLCALTERLLPEIPIRTGKVSHAYLAAACEGSFSENVALLLNSCGNAAADEHDIKQHAASLLSFGASSGADTLAGIVFALSICEKTSAFA